MTAPTAPVSADTEASARIPTITPPVPIELSVVGACNEVSFFARSVDDTVAVSIDYDATKRAADRRTLVDFTLPDPRVTVILMQGTGLGQALCGDVTTDGYKKTTADVMLMSGFGRLSMDPPPSLSGTCGSRGGVHGTLHIEGLADGDGTPIAPIDITTDAIGCSVS